MKDIQIVNANEALVLVIESVANKISDLIVENARGGLLSATYTFENESENAKIHDIVIEKLRDSGYSVVIDEDVYYGVRIKIYW